MVGVNTDGKVKVWLNEDYSMDRPVKGFWNANMREWDMVTKIILLLQKCEGRPTGNFSPIGEELVRTQPMTFERVLRELGNYTINHYFSTMPDRLVTIQNLIKQGLFRPVKRVNVYTATPEFTK